MAKQAAERHAQHLQDEFAEYAEAQAAATADWRGQARQAAADIADLWTKTCDTTAEADRATVEAAEWKQKTRLATAEAVRSTAEVAALKEELSQVKADQRELGHERLATEAAEQKLQHMAAEFAKFRERNNSAQTVINDTTSKLFKKTAGCEKLKREMCEMRRAVQRGESSSHCHKAELMRTQAELRAARGHARVSTDTLCIQHACAFLYNCMQ